MNSNFKASGLPNGRSNGFRGAGPVKKREYLTGDFARDMKSLRIKGPVRNPQTRKEIYVDETPQFITYLTLALQNISEIIGKGKDLSNFSDESSVKTALEGFSFSPFTLTLGETGRFGDLLWVGLEESASLAALVRSLRARLADAGIAFDKKPFKAHITAARYMRSSPPDLPAPRGKMRVEKISLMRSDLKDGKRVYTEICAKEAGA